MANTLKTLLFFSLMCGVVEMKSVSVMEGDSVTLHTDVTEMQGIKLIQWRFGASGSVIAEINGKDFTYPYLTERFGDRRELNHQSGSLTIKNMRIKHSGLYKVEIQSNTGRTSMTFNVTVSDSPPVLDFEVKSVMEGHSLTLQTDVTEPHGDELILWRFGEEGKLIAKADLETSTSKLNEETDERFTDKLELNNQTGSLTITNVSITNSGIYVMKISSSKQTLQKRFNVTVSVKISSSNETLHKRFNDTDSTAPDRCLSPGVVAGIVVALILVFSAAAAGGFYYHHKTTKLEKQNQNGGNESESAETLMSSRRQEETTPTTEVKSINGVGAS